MARILIDSHLQNIQFYNLFSCAVRTYIVSINECIIVNRPHIHIETSLKQRYHL